MTGMTTTSLHKNQAGQPSTNGGHFAAVARTEAPTGLLTPGDGGVGPSLAKLWATEGVVKAAHDIQVAAAPAAMRELIRGVYHEAKTARFRQRRDFDYSYIEPAGFFDADGEGIYDDIQFVDGHLIGEREGARELKTELSYIGRMFSERDEASGMSDFVTSKGADSNTYYTLDLTA
jgi:hypothetical protein